jgi:SAM-dependent MidA family methyltransferase
VDNAQPANGTDTLIDTTDTADTTDTTDTTDTADTTDTTTVSTDTIVSTESALEMVLSPGMTPAGVLMIPRRLRGMSDEQKDSLRQLEISPRALAIWERIAVRIEHHGGAAIAIDYGEEGPLGNIPQILNSKP